MTGNSLRRVDIWVLLFLLSLCRRSWGFQKVGIVHWYFHVPGCLFCIRHVIYGVCVLMLWGLTHPLGAHS